MYLTCFQRRPYRIQGHAVPVQPCGKSVARLMGYHLHIMLGTIKVCKNKGHLVIRKAGAVSSTRFTLGGKHVQKLSLQHSAEESAGLGRKLVIKLPALHQNIIRRPCRPCISGAESQGVVRKAHGIFLGKPCRLLFVNLACHRYQIFHHALPEFLHIVFVVAVSLHPVIAKLGVAVKTKLPPHGIPELYQLVIDRIQLVLMLLIPRPFRFPGSQPPCIIAVRLKGSELGKCVGLSLKRNLCRGNQFGVLLAQIVFFLQLRYDVR